MILNDDFTFEELEKEYLKCTEHLDDSPRSKKLKRATRARIYGLYLRKTPREIINESLDSTFTNPELLLTLEKEGYLRISNSGIASKLFKKEDDYNGKKE